MNFQNKRFDVEEFKLVEEVAINQQRRNMDLVLDIYKYFNYQKSIRSKTATNLLYDDTDGYRVDNLILFNADSTKFISTINISNRYRKDSAADWINRLIGRKVYGKWYFFLGSNLVVPRNFYRYDKYEPLSFLELSYIAREEFLSPFYKIVNGQVVVKHDAVDKTIKLPVHVYGYNNETEENTKHYVDNYIYKDKVIPLDEYEMIKAEIVQSVRPPSEPVKKLTWWDKLQGKKPPIFERKEWKEYVASRSGKD